MKKEKTWEGLNIWQNIIVYVDWLSVLKSVKENLNYALRHLRERNKIECHLYSSKASLKKYVEFHDWA